VRRPITLPGRANPASELPCHRPFAESFTDAGTHLAGLSRHALAFSARGTCVRSRYGSDDYISHQFSRAPGIGQTHQRWAHHVLGEFSPLRSFLSLMRLDRATALQGVAGCVKSEQMSSKCRNINLLPFRVLRLRVPLGPTSPRLMIIVEDPWPLRRHGFSPCFGCYYHQDSRQNAVHRTLQPCFHPRTAPAYPITFRWGRVSVSGIAPSIFQAHNLDQ
jgi:hypothetical protein